MPEPHLILVVEDDAFQRDALAGFLQDSGHKVTTAPDVPSAGALLTEQAFDAVITDFNLPGGTGLDVIQAARSCVRPPATMLVTAYGTIALAVEAMRDGAIDVQVKPIDPTALLATLERGLHTRALELENVQLRERLGERFDFPNLVAESPAMRRILQEVRRIAGTRATVLITGESGTGKEMIANLLHSKGPSANAPFVAVNCAALPESLLEAELFGHVKGAFTGATQDRAGRFEEAEGGSLFLDEIGEIPAAVQVKLLRVLQEREIVRVGENRPRSVSFRLIAATNVDLEAEVAARRFREDLYYRLNVVRMHLPPLRERPEDIRPLATRFVRECAEQNGVPPRPVSDEAMQTLAAYPLPGNVRQLRNIIERALLVATGTAIEATDLALRAPGHTPDELGDASLPDLLKATERRLISRALAEADGVTAVAARKLGIPDRTLRYKIGKLGLRPGND